VWNNSASEFPDTVRHLIPLALAYATILGAHNLFR
jgi:hypothetical protein